LVFGFQTLADFTELITYIQNDYIPSKYRSGAKRTGPLPVIAIGGSYGGMLAAWMRMKYPEVVDMALAGKSFGHWRISTLVLCTLFF
jgi:lysosomal Pro-X carboxypeptidase